MNICKKCRHYRLTRPLFPDCFHPDNVRICEIDGKRTSLKNIQWFRSETCKGKRWEKASAPSLIGRFILELLP